VSLGTLGIDVYQLTTLIAHAADGRPLISDPDAGGQLGMCFFFRRLPRNRRFVLLCGLRSLLEHCQALRFAPDELRTIEEHPLLGPALRSEPGRRVRAALASLDGFVGDIDALPEGTPAFAGPALRTDGTPVLINGTPLHAYTPLVQVRTGLVCAKLIETPWLSRINYLSMVASKAARIVLASRSDGRERSVLEFGQRRTHPQAALDAAYAAYVAGCHATSNLAATHVYGIPSVGTMDHFAVQASERLVTPVHETEANFFARFCSLFPGAATLLVDTYDTWSGIGRAVRATGRRLTGVRLDSNVTPEAVQRAKRLLVELGAGHAQVIVSDGLDEYRVRELVAAGADGFGVGENITCSPDAATGIGAVGKLVLNGHGKLTMKLARGSGKATLPGLLQCYRFGDHDLLTLSNEPAPTGGTPLLQPLWRGRRPVGPQLAPVAIREQTRAQLDALPDSLRSIDPLPGPPQAHATSTSDGSWPILISDRLHQTVQMLVAAASTA
jgi:nicotinate phosphoribosyltransferase